MAHPHPESAFGRLVRLYDTQAKFAQALGPDVQHQVVQQWVARGWASPLYYPRIEPLLRDGITIADLYADCEANRTSRKVAA